MERPKLISCLFMAYFCLHLLLLVTSTACKAKKEVQQQQPKKHVQVSLFIFGDSFLDVGNNNYLNTTSLDRANFWPYGETYFKFPTGRFSDGRLISDFIATYARLPLIPPYLQNAAGNGIDRYYHGANFASAGAGALVETFRGDVRKVNGKLPDFEHLKPEEKTYRDFYGFKVIDLKTQLSYYNKVENWLRRILGNDEAEMKVSKAVYLFSAGSNDYMSPFLTNSTLLLHSIPNSQYVGMVISNITAVVKEIYKTGGRKFAFINLPALGCLPAMRIIKPENKGRCLEEASLLAALHNQALRELLSKLEKQLHGFRYSLFDLSSNLEQRMNQPSIFGFKEGKSACCGTGQFRGVFSCGGKRPVKEFELCENPNEYLFWDSFHLTDHAYEQLSRQMWSAPVPAGDLLISHYTKAGPLPMRNLFIPFAG